MPPIVCIVGQSDSGKTTLIEKLVPELKKRGYRVGTVKHAFHGFDLDARGKDSWRHQRSGADAVVVASPHQMAMVRPVNGDSLSELAGHMQDMHLVLAEGYKRARRPKIEVCRSAAEKPPVCLGDPHLLALVTDCAVQTEVTIFGLEQITPLADLIESQILAQSAESPAVGALGS